MGPKKNSRAVLCRRYVQSFDSCLTRRTVMPEPVLKGMLQGMRTKQMAAAANIGGYVSSSKLSSEKIDAMRKSEEQELQKFEIGNRSGGEREGDASLPGRQTGSEEWRRQRGETGEQ